MKKQFFLLILIASLSFTIYAQTATVISVTGKAEKLISPDTWQALSVGDVLSKGDTVSTSFKTELILKINNDTVTVSSLTRVTIQQLASTASKNETSLFISSGSIKASVNPTDNKREDFTVSSPVATASVRGTSFSFNAAGKLTTYSGMVAKSPSYQKTAEVAEDISEEDSYETRDKKSTVFTSASNISSGGGIPVYQGQTSTTSLITGAQTSPEINKALGDRKSVV